MTISGAVVAASNDLLLARLPMHTAVTLKDTTQVKLAYGLSKGVPMLEARQNTAKNFSVIMRDPATGFGVALAATVSGLTVLIKKGGALSYSVITPTLTPVGSTGLLDIAFTGAHFDTLGVAAINVYGPGVLPNDDLFIDVVAVDKNDAVRGGLSALPDAAAGASGGLPTIGATIPNAVAGTSPGLALKQNVDAVTIAVNTHVDTVLAGVPSAINVRDAVLDALLQDHSTPGSLADGIAIASGLLQGNFMMDNVTNDANGQTAARIRLWRDAAGVSAATSGGSGQGEFAAFNVATSYTSPGKVLVHRVTRVVGT